MIDLERNMRRSKQLLILSTSSSISLSMPTACHRVQSSNDPREAYSTKTGPGPISRYTGRYATTVNLNYDTFAT